MIVSTQQQWSDLYSYGKEGYLFLFSQLVYFKLLSYVFYRLVG